MTRVAAMLPASMALDDPAIRAYLTTVALREHAAGRLQLPAKWAIHAVEILAPNDFADTPTTNLIAAAGEIREAP
ncbi:MAG TPA: hypothetical protein VE155_12755 [Pseudonocardiaceae bacterium]|nr:hypothetical protein [Pseudonocardiaceae bacterium]